MNGTMNISIVLGNLAQDATIRRLENFDSCSLVVITNRWGKKLEDGRRETLSDSHRVQVVGRKGYFDKMEAAGMLAKGAKVSVKGERIEERSGEGDAVKYYSKIRVQPQDLDVLNWPNKGTAPAAAPAAAAADVPPDLGAEPMFGDDEIPF